MKNLNTFLKGIPVLLLGVGLTGCDTLEDLNPFSDEKEAQGLVESLGDNTLTVDGIAYTVTDDTEFEGIDSLADLKVGDEVEIEYEENGGTREAIEIELAGAEDDD